MSRPFDPDVICQMPEDELERLPVGLLRLARDGTILSVNAAEVAAMNRSAEDYIGRDFFTEVAPCTNVREFRGRFERWAKDGTLDETFRFQFNYDDDSALVTIHLRAVNANEAFVIITRSEVSGA